MELLAVIGVTVPLMLLFFQMVATSAQALTTIQGLGQAELEANGATDSFMRDVRQATALDTTIPGGEFTQDLTSVGESPNGRATLILRVPSTTTVTVLQPGDPPTSVPIANKFDYIIYDFTESGPTAQQLRRIVRTDPSSSRPTAPRVVANRITSITFNNFPGAPPAFGEAKMRLTVIVRQDRYSFQIGDPLTDIVNCSAAWRNGHGATEQVLVRGQ